MIVSELIAELKKCNPDQQVRLMTLDGDDGIFEVRRCSRNVRCDSPYVELSSALVPKENLGETD